LAIWSAPGLMWGLEVNVKGRVVDENSGGIGGVRVSLSRDHAAIHPKSEYTAVSGPDGRFTLVLPSLGAWNVGVHHDGFYAVAEPVEIRQSSQDLYLVLARRRLLRQNLQVSAEAGTVDLNRTHDERNLSGPNLVNIPYSGRDLRGALKLMPGVVQDAKEGLHLAGGSPNQAIYTLDGFNITDPLTGRFSSRVNVDSVRSVEYSSGRYSPEFGKGSAGVVAISTETGSDRLRYSATNFVPGIDMRGGAHIGTWAPRFGLSGPVYKGRAWFSSSSDMEYSQLVVEDIRAGKNRTPSLRLNQLLRTQINLRPSNILSASFLANTWNAPGWGLSALDPPSATINRRTRTWFFSLKDQMYLTRGMLLELGYAENRTFGRQIPQGDQVYQITPSGRRGNYFADSTQTAERKQWLANLFLPSFDRGGRHNLKTGVDLDRIGYRQAVRRTAFENYGLAGNLIRRTTFQGSGRFSRPGMEASWYVVDSWKVRSQLMLELGIRQDWDELVRKVVTSPRLSFSWAPLGAKDTKLSGGFAVTHDPSSLELFAQPLDQAPVNTSYRPDGTIERGPALSIFAIGNRSLTLPRYRNWTLALERRLPRNITFKIGGLRKRGSDGFTYLNTLQSPETNVEARFDLFNYRRDVYDSLELQVRQPIHHEYEWMASYTRSRSLSNAVLSITADNTTQVNSNVGRMPWDAPDRFLAWAYLPTRWPSWAVASMLEARSGYPFSVQYDDGAMEGEVNSKRLPSHISLDLHLERRLRLRGNRFALRGGFSNITNHRNPTVVNNVIGSPQFMEYFGSQGRRLLFRLRWLGKSGT
jgi:hypothetical protein